LSLVQLLLLVLVLLLLLCVCFCLGGKGGGGGSWSGALLFQIKNIDAKALLLHYGNLSNNSFNFSVFNLVFGVAKAASKSAFKGSPWCLKRHFRKVSLSALAFSLCSFNWAWVANSLSRKALAFAFAEVLGGVLALGAALAFAWDLASFAEVEESDEFELLELEDDSSDSLRALSRITSGGRHTHIPIAPNNCSITLSFTNQTLVKPPRLT
jgi:hypothetical protein